MVQLPVSSVRSLPAASREIAGAGRLASDSRHTNSGRGGSAEAGDTGVFGDRQDVAVSVDFGTEKNGRSMAALNTAKGASLLQVADEALVTIGVRLDQFTSLAAGAESRQRSNFKRAQFDVLFQSIKGEIDNIAATTTFDGKPLLQGGVGPRGEFQVSFQIGTGVDAHDEITVLIAPASVSDLSAALATDSIATQVGATTARSNVAAAQNSLNVIRGGIAGDIERFSIAIRESPSIGQGWEITRAALFDPTIPVDLSRKVAGRAAGESGFMLTDRAIDQTRQLLIKFGAPTPATGKRAA